VSPEARAALLRVAAALVPARDDLPSAGDEETLGAWLDREAVARPVLVAEVAELGERALVDGDRAVLDLVAAGAASTFSAIVLEAWFRHPGVRARFGYAGVTPVAAVADADAMRVLAAPVAQRPAPAGTAVDPAPDRAVASPEGAA
jgi:hypothetical protein